MAKKNSASDIALKLYNAISSSSAEYVADQLDKICETSVNYSQFAGNDKEIVDYIVNACCVKYQVSPESIKRNRIREENSLFARNMSVVLIQKHVHSSTHKKIAKEMNKQDHTFVCQILKNYEKMEGKVKHERQFLEAFKELNDNVFSFRKKHKLKQ